MSGNKIDLSIVIVNFNSKRFLGACLSSIRRKILSEVGAEVIIVNNDRREKMEDIKNQFPEVIFVDNLSNKGYGCGCNAGARIVRGRYILFLNPDTRIASRGIESLIRFWDRYRNIGAIGARLVTPEGGSQEWSIGPRVNLFHLIMNNLQIPSGRRILKCNKPRTVSWVSGTALFVKKEIFETLGGFDENIFMYFEDVDLCERIRKINKKIVYFPNFYLIHEGGKSYDDKNEQKQNYYDSQEYYFKKHCGPVQTALLRILRKMFT